MPKRGEFKKLSYFSDTDEKLRSCQYHKQFVHPCVCEGCKFFKGIIRNPFKEKRYGCGCGYERRLK